MYNILCPSAKPHAGVQQEHNHHLKSEEEEKGSAYDFKEIEEEEDVYNLSPEDIYDTVDDNDIFNLGVLNRPPAPIPRPESMTDLEKPQNYISRGIRPSLFISPQIPPASIKLLSVQNDITYYF